jgi:hypothetical protein
VNEAPELKSSPSDIDLYLNETYTVVLPGWTDEDTPDTHSVNLEDGDGSRPSFIETSDNRNL